MYYGYEAPFLVIENINHGEIRAINSSQGYDSNVFHIIQRCYTREEAANYVARHNRRMDEMREQVKKCFNMQVEK